MNIPRAHRWLVLAGLALSAAALALNVTEACASCGQRSWVSITVAAAGVLAYAALAVIAARGLAGPFFAGVSAAAGVHVVLVVLMISAGRACPVCITAAVASFTNMGLAIVRRVADLRVVQRAFFPALLASAGLAYGAIVTQGAQQARTAAAARQAALAARADHLPAEQKKRGLLLIYEHSACSYCQDFRDQYAPALHREFADRLAIRYVDATTTDWVRRTPTICTPDGRVYEGLPSYEELRAAVAESLRLPKP